MMSVNHVQWRELWRRVSTTAPLARLLLTAWACACLASVAPVSAQSAPADRTEEAKGLFSAARAAFEAGRYADALDYFQRSYEISKRPELLYNIGLVRDRLRDDERALEAYEAYLAALPNAPNRAEVEQRAGAIRQALATRQSPAPATTAPTPEQTAAAATPAPSPANPATTAAASTQPAEHPSIVSRWWFWTAVGVVVVGAVTAGAIAASSGGTTQQAALSPKSGLVVTTLRRAP